jgi:hypothetical protein
MEGGNDGRVGRRAKLNSAVSAATRGREVLGIGKVQKKVIGI